MERNLWRYLAFSALVHTPAFVPIVVLFWEQGGLDLQQVFLLQGLYAFAVVLLEVPTGMVADRVGKRTSVLLAAAIFAGSLLFYAVGTGFWWFLAAELALALGGALYSGADAALLYDTLKALEREAEYTKWSGRGRAVQLTSFALSNIAGGLIGAWSLPAAVAISAVGPVLAVPVAWGFVEVQQREAPESFRQGLREYRDLLASALRFVRKHRLVRWYTLYFAVLQGSAVWLLWLYQPYMALSGLPVWAFGLAFALYNAFAAGASALSHRLEEVLGHRGSLVALAVLQIAPLVLMALFVTPASFLFVLGQQAVRAVGRPILTDRILAYTWEDKRATVLSLGSLGARLFFTVTAPLVGWASDALTLPQALLVQAGLLVLLVAALAVEWLRVPPKYHRIKAQAQATG